MKFGRNAWPILSAACMALASALAGCGGGSSGAGAQGEGTVALTPNQFSSAAINTFDEVDDLFLFGTLVTEVVARGATLGAALSVPCANTGSLSIELVDRDGSGRLSDGDDISLRLDACGLPMWGSTLWGECELRISVSRTDSVGGNFSALVSTVGILSVDSGVGGQIEPALAILGSFRVDAARSEKQAKLRLSSAASDDLTHTRRFNGRLDSASIRAFDLTKSIDYTLGRIELSLDMDLEGDELNGKLLVRTIRPLALSLDNRFQAGQIDLIGAASRRIAVQPGGEPGVLLLNLQDGSTQGSLAAVELPRVSLGARYLSWDGLSQGIVTGSGVGAAFHVVSPDYLAILAVEAGFHYQFGRGATALDRADEVFLPGMLPPRDATSPEALFRLQFSQVPRQPLVGFHFRLKDAGAVLTEADPSVKDVELISQVDGALVQMRPVEPLRHGHQYWLELSVDGTSWGETVSLNLQDGTAFEIPLGLVHMIYTTSFAGL